MGKYFKTIFAIHIHLYKIKAILHTNTAGALFIFTLLPNSWANIDAAGCTASSPFLRVDWNVDFVSSMLRIPFCLRQYPTAEDSLKPVQKLWHLSVLQPNQSAFNKFFYETQSNFSNRFFF